jgi:hypothetical protein
MMQIQIGNQYETVIDDLTRRVSLLAIRENEYDVEILATGRKITVKQLSELPPNALLFINGLAVVPS